MTRPQSPQETTPVQPPPNPDQPVPMVHANTQNNHTTLVVVSAHYGSQMLTNIMMGFDQLMDAYTTTGTVTEGQLYAALWPEADLLEQASTVFGPNVVTYITARDTFAIRVGTHERYVSTQQTQRIAAALADLGDTALARRAIYLVCVTNTANLHALLAPRDEDSDCDDAMYLITYARQLHRYVPDIDAQLARIATAQHRPMRHGVTTHYHERSTGTSHSTRAAVLPAYIGRDGGVCTSASILHHGTTPQYDPAVDRIITANPVVMQGTTADDLRNPPNIAAPGGTTVEHRAVLAGGGADAGL